MKRVLKIAGIALVALLVLFVGIGFFLTPEWSVERSILVQAPPETIHPWIESPARWREWFDFDEMDQRSMVTLSGPEKGVGATYSWVMPGSRGTLTIVDSDPKTGIHISERIESDEENARGSMVYTPAEGGMTRVTWTDHGTLPKVVGGWLHGLLEKQLGASFERSLAKLKARVEAAK